MQADYKSAVKVCLEALQFSPDNAEVLTTIGLLYLRMGDNFKAFDYLGNSLTKDPRSVKTILAAASVIQASLLIAFQHLARYFVAQRIWKNLMSCCSTKLS